MINHFPSPDGNKRIGTMFRRIRVQNFRIFNELNIGDLHRVNLISGLNGSGKTSLLEAVFILSGAGHPQLFMNPSIMRGLGPDIRVLTSSKFPWNEFFPMFDMHKAIEIIGTHEKYGDLSLEITFKRSQTAEIHISREESALDRAYSEQTVHVKNPVSSVPDVPTLLFRYNGAGNVQKEGHIRTNAHGLEVSQPMDAPLFDAIYVTSRTGDDQEDAKLLAIMRRKKHSELLLEALKIFEPKLQSIEDNSATGVPMICCDIGLDELIPLPVMGDGMTRMARLVLAISSVPNGVVLVDEIENGFHYSLLPKVWKVVDKASKSYNTQVIAATHSYENIEAANYALDAESFRVHRIESLGKKNRCVTYVPESLSAAIEHGLEVR